MNIGSAHYLLGPLIRTWDFHSLPVTILILTNTYIANTILLDKETDGRF